MRGARNGTTMVREIDRREKEESMTARVALTVKRQHANVTVTFDGGDECSNDWW
jgi:hypothetical protein